MLEIIFITSSNAKLEHAKYLCREYVVHISKQKHYGVGYIEPRIYDRKKLIELSIDDVIKRCKKNIHNAEDKFFLIEDTSVIIPTLSNDREYPGVDIKYWMQEHNFSDIDKQLKDLGNDRKVTVRSDLVLILPYLVQKQIGIKDNYKIFTSYVDGRIVDKELKIETQPLYPWLSGNTFNKWFVPNGCENPISMLPIKIADMHDFRAGAFQEMLCFLEKQKIIQKRNSQIKAPFQVSLFTKPLLFVICGPTCAGKTTLATHLMKTYNYYHIEASDFMYLSYYERHGIGSSVDIGNFAEHVLKDNPSIVVDQVIKSIQNLGDTPIIVTGYRSLEEINSFKRQYRGSLKVEEVFVDADQAKRFERYQIRTRRNNSKNKEDFKAECLQQEKMGISTIRKELASKTFENNGNIADYFEIFKKSYHKHLIYIQGATNIYSLSTLKPKRLEDEIILVLANKFDSGDYFTTTQISQLINEIFTYFNKPKSKNNVSRYFNQYFRPYYEIKLNSGKKYYRLSHTGMAHAYCGMYGVKPYLLTKEPIA